MKPRRFFTPPKRTNAERLSAARQCLVYRDWTRPFDRSSFRRSYGLSEPEVDQLLAEAGVGGAGQ